MDKMLTRLIFFVVAILTGTAIPASAQQIAADFAQIDDCAGVNRFASRHSGHPSYRSYSGQLANLRRTFCQPRTQRPQTATVRPAPGRPGTARPVRAAPRSRPPAVTSATPTTRPIPRTAPRTPSRTSSRPAARAPGRTAPPAPQPSRYLSAVQVANLYRDHFLCYEFTPSGTCGAYEAANSDTITGDGMRLVQRYGHTIADHLRRSLSDGAPFLAEAMLVTDIQTVSFAEDALCRSRNQRILDAYLTRYHLQEHGAARPNTRIEEVSSAVLERMRDDDARAEADASANLICSRYRRDPGSGGTQIIEEAYFDGALRSTATIRLLPRRQGLPTLHW